MQEQHNEPDVMRLEGIKDLVPFLNFLKKTGVWYALHHFRDDTIMVMLTLYGERIEVDFFDDHIEYSRFRGNEDVEEDQEVLFGLIAEFVRE